MHYLQKALVLVIGLVFCTGVGADEYRKCNLKIVVSGEGLSETEVPGTRFWAWARRSSAWSAWNSINIWAEHCARDLALGDHESLPRHCSANERLLHNGLEGEGITGISSLLVHTKIKDTICRHHQAKFLSASDTREIDGFAVTIKPVGRSKACHTKAVVGPRVQTIHCYKEGTDSDFEWHYVLRRSEPASQQQASADAGGEQPEASADNAAGQGWRVSAPKVRQRTLSGEFPAGGEIPMSIDITNASGNTRWPGESGGIVIKVAGAFPTGSIAALSLPSLAQGNTTTVNFSATPATPGGYAYFACLSGLKDAGGWPLPDICGPNTRVTVGPAVTPTFSTLPQLQVLPAPAQGAAQPAPQPGGAPRPAGSPANQQGDAAPPQFGVLPQLQLLPPPAGAPAAAAPQAAAPAQQAAPPAGGQLECRGGEVKGILCWCGIGRFPRPLGGNVWQCQ